VTPASFRPGPDLANRFEHLFRRHTLEQISASPGLETLQVVNLRLGGFAAPEDEPFEEPLSALAEVKHQGLVQHIGLSTVSARQLAEAQAITEIVCIQNLYNLAHRGDDGFIDDLATQGIAYVPYFPLGGFSPLQSAALDAAAASLQNAGVLTDESSTWVVDGTLRGGGPQ